MSSSTPSFPKLNDSNYEQWKDGMTAWLKKAKVWRVVAGTRIKPKTGDAEIEAFEDDLDRATGELLLWIEDGQKTHVKGVEDDPVEIWKQLEAAHTSKRPLVRFNAYDDFFSIRMKEGEKMQQVAGRVDEAMQRIQSLRPDPFTIADLDKELTVLGMIRALPKETHAGFISSLLLLDKLEKATVLEAFRNEQTQRDRGESDSSDYVLVSKQAAKAATMAPAKVAPDTCAVCGKAHPTDRCFILIRFKKWEKAQKEKKAQSTSAQKAEEVIESAGSASLNLTSSSANVDKHWTADTGASSHMTPHREWIRNYEPYRTPIRLADHTIIYSEGRGSILFNPMIDDKSVRGVELTQVLHVPKLRNNLLAVVFLTRRRNYQVHIDADNMNFIHGGKKVFVASIGENNIAYLNGTTAISEEHANFIATLPLDYDLWHRRLGHHNFDGVKRLVNQGLVTGMTLNSKAKPDPVCEPCLAGKMHANPFPSSPHQTKRVLELIHTDVKGPLSVQTPSGFKYWSTFIDDHTDFWAVFPMQKKSDTFLCFKRYKAYAENKQERRIAATQEDKGGEYMSNAFEQYCIDEGIFRRHTVRNRPQQNGHGERANRTIADGVTAMLNEANMPMSFWYEATAAFVHARNMCSTSKNPHSTPYTEWHKEKPDIGHLRVWGCLAYVHIQKDKRVGLSPHMEKCIFIGYPSGYKGWKFYNPVTKKVIISERADFDERCFPGLKKANMPADPPLQYPSDPLVDEPSAPVVPPPVPLSPAPPAPAAQHPGGDSSDSDSDPELPKPPLAPPSVPPRSPDRPPPPNSPPLAQRRAQREIRPPPDWRIPLARPKTPPAPDPEPIPAPSPSSSEDSSGPEFDGYGEVQFTIGTEETANVAAGTEPRSMHELKNRPDGHLWMEAAQKEYDGLVKNGTWEIVKLPPGRKAIGSMFTFLLKRNSDGSIARHKARLVANGNTQVKDIDFKEVFSPTYRQAAIRLILSIAAKEDLELRSVDISMAFTHGELDEEMYMKQPPGFEVKGPEYVCRLIKSIYGLHQSARCWNKKIHKILTEELGFKRLESDRSIYLYGNGDTRIIMPIYVDDITFAGKSNAQIDHVIKKLSEHVPLYDLGETEFLLGVKITRDRPNRTINLSQHQYIVDLLERHGMGQCAPVKTPMVPNSHLTKTMCPQTPEEQEEMKSHPYINIVGAIMYLAFFTRPDILFAVVVLARFMSNPGLEHWTALKHLMRYLQGTKDMKLTYKPDNSKELFISYCDADHGGNKDNGKSTGGYLMTYGGGAISWSSKLQPFVSLSTTEAEYIAACEAGKEILWLRNLLTEFGYKVDSPSILKIDNQSALTVSKNPEHHGRMKHLDLRYFWLRETVELGKINPEYIPTSEMPADLLTKALPRASVEKFREMMGLTF